MSSEKIRIYYKVRNIEAVKDMLNLGQTVYLVATMDGKEMAGRGQPRQLEFEICNEGRLNLPLSVHFRTKDVVESIQVARFNPDGPPYLHVLSRSELIKMYPKYNGRK